MKKVSICIILNNDYYGTIYSFVKSGFVIVEKKGEFVIKDAPKEYVKVIDGVEIELLVAYTETSDKRLVDYFKPIATKLIEVKSSSIGSASDAQAYNELFRIAQNEYVCILKPYILLQQYWLTELIHYYEEINKSGIIGICSSFTNIELAPLPSKELETFTDVFLPKDNMVNCNGIMFFLTQYLYLIGALDEGSLFVGATEFMQLQKRFATLGYNNYYIPSQACLIVNEHKYADYVGYRASEEKLNSSLLEMKKAKNYYIPL